MATVIDNLASEKRNKSYYTYYGELSGLDTLKQEKCSFLPSIKAAKKAHCILSYVALGTKNKCYKFYAL